MVYSSFNYYQLSDTIISIKRSTDINRVRMRKISNIFGK